MSYDISVNDEQPPVIVLGAGFSKALSDVMPLTDELGDAVRNELSVDDQARLPAGRFSGTGGRFEEWLSYLAEDQPHLSEDRLLEARALLYRVTRVLRSVLVGRQFETLSQDAPPWFYELLTMLHVSRATVLSLNYDNLIECGVETHHLPAPRSARTVAEEDLLEGLPPSAEPEDRFYDNFDALLELSAAPRIAPRANTFRLLKLHGSLSWYWTPGDATGSTLQRWRLPGTFGHPQADEPQDRRRVLPGSEPFIVPPAALKSEHLRSPIVRELWRRADEALRVASRIVLIGYSLPTADRTFGGMLADALRDRAVTVEVVDRASGLVTDRLKRLGIVEGVIAHSEADDCVPRWVARERDALAKSMAEQLKGAGLTGHELLYVVLNQTVGVVGVRQSEVDTPDVVVERDPPGRVVGQPCRSRELLGRLIDGHRVVVEVDDQRLSIVGFEVDRQPVANQGRLDQVRLLPAGRVE